MLSQSEVIDSSSNFINQHGFTSFLLIVILLAISYFIWRVWVFTSPLFSKWIETNITTTNRNADSLELISSAISAIEKTNELLIAETRGTRKEVIDLKRQLAEIRNHILTIEDQTNEDIEE
jgi:hypothetical protein